MRKWVEASEDSGERWVINMDEIGPASTGVMPDSHDAAHDTVRNNCLWGSLLAGGAGVEWYFGYRFSHNDLDLEDFRSRENWWSQSTIATQFMTRFPLEEMSCMDELVDAAGAYCLAREGELYLVYFPAGTAQAHIELNQSTPLNVSWFNPRTGGDLQSGSVNTISGKGQQYLGAPPSDPNLDWVVVIEN